ncbi:MAG: zf-HC2 domain-containing protein [Lachnospiraceae bacterium]
MNRSCDCNIIQDLLPLYQDRICSEESRKIVEEHLKTCNTCREFERKLKNMEVDRMLFEEKESVLKKHARREKENIIKKIIYIDTLINVLLAIICARPFFQMIPHLFDKGRTLSDIDYLGIGMICPLMILCMFLICDGLYFFFLYRKKIPFITEKMAYISAFTKLTILIIVLINAAAIGLSEILPLYGGLLY